VIFPRSTWFGLLLLGFSCCIAPGPSVKNEAAPSAAPNAVAATPAHAFVWPEGARAAVSLTYDDAIQSQIDNAVPALAKHSLRATFFLSGASPYLQAHPEAYRGLVSAGHELGSHTMNHPCDRAQSWVRPGFGLQDYDLDRMQKEIADNIQQLEDFGQKAPFVFAFPCGSTWVGENHTSYVKLVEDSFIAARSARPGVADPTSESLFDIPTALGNEDGPQLISWVDRALAAGGWIVFTFHGVAGDYLDVKADAHEALLAYLDAHKTNIWIEPFGTVAAYVKAQRAAKAP
jgi:peptidoglycan/xylan/chitin deacetylase (PgdA/CDA1 family)